MKLSPPISLLQTVALKLGGILPPGPEPQNFDIGPHQAVDPDDPTQPGDLRQCRPYFLVPLGTPESDAPRSDMRETIRRWLLSQNPRREKPVSDVYVLSHGWHRNLFDAVSVYDRLHSRLVRRLLSGRLDIVGADGKPRRDPDFNPVFLNLHWHSDPGEDGWVDACGRRHKASFLANAREVFAPAPEDPKDPHTFTDDFESLYELFSRISAPGKEALSDAQINVLAPLIARRLDAYQLQDAPGADYPAKVTVAWTCYHEADARGILLDQEEQPGRYLSFGQALRATGKIAFALLGVSFFLGLLIGPLKSLLPKFSLTKMARAAWPPVRDAVQHPLPILHHLGQWLIGLPAAIGHWTGHNRWFLLCAVVVAVFLWVAELWQRVWTDYKRHHPAGRGLDDPETPTPYGHRPPPIPVPRLLAVWGYAQTLFGLAGLAFIAFLMARDLGLFAHSQLPRLPSLPAHPWLEALLGALLYLGGVGLWKQCRLGDRPGRGFPFASLAATLYSFAFLIAPGAVYLILTYFFGRAIVTAYAWLCRVLPFLNALALYDERVGKRGQSPDGPQTPDWDVRPWLAWLGRIPYRFFQHIVAADSPALAPLRELDKQLAFYEMQRLAVRSGDEAGAFLADLLADPELKQGVPGWTTARLHFVGHSFGAVVICNVVRHLAYAEDAGGEPALTRPIHSFCSLQGAVQSDWFGQEPKVQKSIKIIAAIFSQYDLANGSIYPVGNNGRVAQGYVGLNPDGPAFIPEPRGGYPSLTRTPDLTVTHGSAPPDGAPRVLNLDASRLIYAGPKYQGGHDDVFKDDVVHLVWAVTKAETFTNAQTFTLSGGPGGSPPSPPISPTPEQASLTSRP